MDYKLYIPLIFAFAFRISITGRNVVMLSIQKIQIKCFKCVLILLYYTEIEEKRNIFLRF